MRHVYMDRNIYLGDSKFIKNPIDRLTSKHYAAEICKKSVANKVIPSENVLLHVAMHENPETTHHYSIIDHGGNAISTTYTVNGRFSAVVVAPGTDFLLNDEMDDFTG